MQREREVLSTRQRFGSRWASSGSASWCSGLSSARSSLGGAMAPGTSAMLRARRRDVNVKPNRRLDRSSTRGMIYENEELRLRTININAEVERSQDDIKKLRRENDQLRRELWGLRDEYDKLEALLKRKQVGDASDEFSEDEEEGEVEEEEEEDGEQSGEEEEEEEEEDEDDDGAGGDRAAERVEADPAQDDATKSAATSRDRQVDFDMLSVVQEETENDQTDSQTGGEDQGASPIIPRKKGVCFLLEPLPEHQPAPAEQPQQPAQPAPQPTPQPPQPGVQLVCDQYLVSAEGKPLRGAAGQFLTTADLARDPFQYPAAYGYATGTIVGGVLIPAVDPSTGIPLTGLYQEDAYGTEVPVAHGLNGGHVNGSALGFDGLVPEMSWAAASSSSSPAQTEDDPQMPVMQPRGAPDLFVDGAYPVGQSADGSPSSGVIEQLLRNINLGVVDDPAGTGEVAEDGTECRVGGVFVALRGVPVGVPDSDVSAALSQLGVVVGGIHRLGGPGPQDGGAAGDGDPGGGGEVQERAAHLVPWPQLPHQSTLPPLPTHLGVAGTLAELRQLSEHEASLLDLEDSGDMRDKSLRDSSAVNDKPFRSQIQVRLRHPQVPPGPGGGSLRGPRLVAAASPPTGRREAATNSLPLRGRQLCAQGAAAPGPAPVPLQAPRARLLGPALQPHVIPGYHTGTLRRPSTPFPVGMLRAPGPPMGPLAPLNAGPRAAPATHALSGADLPVVTMPMPLAVVTNGRPVPMSAGALAESCGDATPALSLAAPAPSSLRSLPASPAASPAPSRRAPHGKRLLRKQSSAQSLEEPVTNGNALAPSPSSRRRMAKQKAHAQGEPGTPGAVSTSGSTATPGTPSKHPGQAGRPHAADVSQSSSSGQESPNKSERRRRVSILSRKPRRAPSPTDAILPADHTTTASERERTNSASSRDSRVSAWRATGRRRLSSIRRDNSTERESGKVPWCGCWGNGCL